MELDELHIGDPAPRPPGHRDAIPGRRIGIGGVEIDLAGAAGGQQRTAGAHCKDFAVAGVEHIGAETALVGKAQFGAGNQVDRDVIFEYRDVRVDTDLAGERLLDCGTGRVRNVNYPSRTVTTFAGQVITIGCLGERNTLRDQPLDGRPPVLDDEARGCPVVQPCTGDQGVVDVCLDRVLAVEDSGNSALGPARGGILQGAFADQRDTAFLRQAQRGRLAGQSTTDDENVEMLHGVQG